MYRACADASVGNTLTSHSANAHDFFFVFSIEWVDNERTSGEGNTRSQNYIADLKINSPTELPSRAPSHTCILFTMVRVDHVALENWLF